MKRANYLGAPGAYNLNQICRVITEAFGNNPYLVGSATERKDYRDVDVRLILDDAEFDRMFPNFTGGAQYNALWCLICTSISEWLASRTGLPIDFQIQRQTEANAEHDGPRHALGLFYARKPG